MQEALALEALAKVDGGALGDRSHPARLESVDHCGSVLVPPADVRCHREVGSLVGLVADALEGDALESLGVDVLLAAALGCFNVNSDSKCFLTVHKIC